jgi:dienelactone hydrolase
MRSRRLIAVAAVAALIVGALPAAGAGARALAVGAGGMTLKPPPPPPQLVQLAGPHHYSISTRWVVLHRGTRVIRTLLITPHVARGAIVPAIEFAHGWDSNPTVYLNLLRAWASAGFFVIAPTSPGMARGPGLLSTPAAVSEQMADLPVVLTQVLAMQTDVVVNPRQIALAGHSDGGITVATMAFNRGYRDSRISAYLILSGGTTAQNSGPSHTRTNSKPVFIADSYADQYGNWPSAGTFFRQARGPKVLVGIGRGETHLSPWAVASAFNEDLWNSTVDFARWAFTGSGTARTQMIAALHVPGFGVSLR